MKKLHKWLETRRKTKAREKFLAGFGWAMAEYYIEGRAVSDIEVETHPCCGRDCFDEGAIKALRIIEQHISGGGLGLTRVGFLNLYKYDDTGKLFVTGRPKESAEESHRRRSSTPTNEYMGAVEVFVTKPRVRLGYDKPEDARSPRRYRSR